MDLFHWTLAGGAAAFGLYARHLARALRGANYRLENMNREKQAVFDFLNRLGERITQGVDVKSTLELVTQFLQDATSADAAAIFLRSDSDPNVLKGVVVQGLFPPLHKATTTDKLLAKRKYVADKVRHDSIRVGEGIIGRVAETGKGVLIRDAERDERVPRDASEIVPIRDLLLAPLVVRDEVLGVLALVNKRQEPPFNEGDESLVNAIAEQAAVTLDLFRLYRVLADKQRYESQIRLARDFQEFLLPREVPDVEAVELWGMSRPALDLGGDYFDFLKVDDEHIGIAIADVSGKGIPAALVMASVRATLHAECKGNRSPKNVLERVNRQAKGDTKPGVFITMTYGVLNTKTGVLKFCRAGHEPLVAARESGAPLVEVAPKGMALALVDGDPFNILLEEREVRLEELGTAILYTDGVTEAKNLNDDEYGEDRLFSVFRSCASEPPRAITERIAADVGQFSQNREQHDDVTIVVMQWKKKAPAPAGGA